MKITKEWLLDHDFKPGEKDTFKNISLAYYVRNAVCLFYNEPFAGSFLIGYGFTHEGNYYASTFYWIEYTESVYTVYESITLKKLDFNITEK